MQTRSVKRSSVDMKRSSGDIKRSSGDTDRGRERDCSTTAVSGIKLGYSASYVLA